jgi:ankyrin repeat protein
MTKTNINLKAKVFQKQTKYIQSVLSLAIEYNDKNTVEILLDEVDHCPEICNKTLLSAIEYNDFDIIAYILEKKVLSDQEIIGSFVVAARSSDRKTIESFMNQDCISINTQDDNGRTVLHSAINNSKEVFQYIYNYEDIDPNIKDKNGDTPLHIGLMCPSNRVNIMSLLEDQNLDLNIKNNNGNTPIANSIAYLHKYPELIDKLISRGADFNAIESDTCYAPTLLMESCDYNRVDMVKKLLTISDLDVNYETKDGNSALSIAFKRKNSEIIELLINHQNIKTKLSTLAKIKMFFTPWTMKTKALKNMKKKSC